MAFGKDTPPEVGAKTQFKPGQSGNPNGVPKGTKHINTWVQEILHDPDFEAQIQEGYTFTTFKGAPITAIIKAQVKKAVAGDTKAFDSLVKSGWAQKTETDITTLGDKIESHGVDTDILTQFMMQAKSDTKQQTREYGGYILPTMPKVSFYLRKEDIERWKAVNKKTEFIHEALATGTGINALKAISNRSKSVTMPPPEIVLLEVEDAIESAEARLIYTETTDWGA